MRPFFSIQISVGNGLVLASPYKPYSKGRAFSVSQSPDAFVHTVSIELAKRCSYDLKVLIRNRYYLYHNRALLYFVGACHHDLRDGGQRTQSISCVVASLR